ncbi:hypothetical protein C4D60_Mb06t33300 [Musa balbisiana]|uniref:Uncharacterized protein n=1 Tax=Musa balbisiana TaxID=52838 RepID=A0A4S8ITT3_MUSBA|nr:hypothetical protein C4D60_Mb06t33300 [Musa balbisiana]
MSNRTRQETSVSTRADCLSKRYYQDLPLKKIRMMFVYCKNLSRRRPKMHQRREISWTLVMRQSKKNCPGGDC